MIDFQRVLARMRGGMPAPVTVGDEVPPELPPPPPLPVDQQVEQPDNRHWFIGRLSE